MTDATKLLLRGGRLVDPASGHDGGIDLLVQGGRVAAMGAEAKTAGASVLDCDGLVVAPGLVDLHTHLRQPGREDKETVETGSRAAATGGYTAITAMANTDPVADNASVALEVRSLGDRAALCEVFPAGAITKGLLGESLSEIGEMAAVGVRIFSDDGRCVQRARLLRLALEYASAFDVLIAEHCEEESLAEGAQMHEGYYSSVLGLASQPREAEEIAVARDLQLARLTAGRLHLCHLSSAGSVELVRRAKREGLRVTAEVTPHHLALCDENLTGFDTNLKVNPPLRSEEDRDALRAGLADGTIDAIATDHAPHAVEEKEQEFDRAPPGTTGLETALAVALTELVHPGLVPLGRVIEAMSTSPARILGASEQGGPVELGAVANLVAFDPDAEWVVDAPFASKSRNSAFLGRSLRGRVVHTLYRGDAVVEGGKAQR
jgi:dihydroorotase